MINDTSRKAVILIPVLVCVLSGFTTFRTTVSPSRAPQVEKMKPDSLPPYKDLKRVVPNPINNEIPRGYKQSVARNVRTQSGNPGPNYWQQQSDYDIDVRILPKQKKLIGHSAVTYHNNSPDTLRNIYFALTLNVDKKGAIRNLPQHVSGGFHIQSFSYDGTPLDSVKRRNQTGYTINGTVMRVVPPHPLLPGDTVTMKTSYDFNIPRSGAGTGRIGYDDDNLFFIAYWYPKVRVYDDVAGWSTDPFLGIAQFYNEFGHYNVHVTVPAQWIVAATGRLTNAGDVLRDPIRQQMIKAHQSDSVMHVVQKKDFGHVTKAGKNGELTWNFTAKKVNDFVFSLTKASMWDATRAPVGDLDGDGTTDYTNIDAFYRSSAPLWKHAARFEQDAIKHHSQFTGLYYPWPHMTAVEAGDIRGGGMEYPMMTLISPERGGNPRGLYSVIAHELGHEWDPMQLATNERRYGWMDESTATFLESQAAKDFYNIKKVQVHKYSFNSYLRVTKTDQEGPIMRWSDYQYSGLAHGVA
ncbi:MAG TPA: M1 family metallopeptidase, partial [Balneolaceae bacterium]|nr:M1 family metallopeptidase [Balneolaceae bacterium]